MLPGYRNMKVFAVLLIWLHFGSYSEQTALNCSYKVADKALATVKNFLVNTVFPIRPIVELIYPKYLMEYQNVKIYCEIY